MVYFSIEGYWFEYFIYIDGWQYRQYYVMYLGIKCEI